MINSERKSLFTWFKLDLWGIKSDDWWKKKIKKRKIKNQFILSVCNNVDEKPALIPIKREEEKMIAVFCDHYSVSLSVYKGHGCIYTKWDTKREKRETSTRKLTN